MATADNSAFGPPPLATPITADNLDKTGIPFLSRGVPTGNLHTVWSQWFNALGVRVESATAFIADTAANMANYAPAAYSPGLYYQTDRNVIYRSDGTAWLYLSGTMTDTYANIPTLGANDLGFQFFDTTHWRLFEWVAAGAAPASTSPGWQRGNQEVPTGYIGILPFGPGAQIGSNGWQLCNGTLGVSITQDDASTTAVDMPNFTGGAYPKGGSTATYGPTGATPTAATLPTISGATELATIGFNPAAGAAPASVATNHGAASGGDFLAVVTINGGGGGGGGSLITDPHQHDLTAANAPIALPADPVAHVRVPFYMKR